MPYTALEKEAQSVSKKLGQLLDRGKKNKKQKAKVEVKMIKKLQAKLKERQERWLDIDILSFH